MGRSSETFSKKEKEKKRQKKKEAKQQRKEERQANSNGGGLDAMIAYVDEFGNIVDTPPDPSKREEVDADSIELGVPSREVTEEDLKHEGRVEFFNDSKGFGFIRENGTRERYFVHVHGTLEPIAEGDSVSFEVERGPKGLNAVQVKKTS